MVVSENGRKAKAPIWRFLDCFLIRVLGAQVYSIGEDKSSNRLTICAPFCVYVIFQ